MGLSIAEIRKASNELRSLGQRATPSAVAKRIRKPVQSVRLYADGCIALLDVFDAESQSETCDVVWPTTLRSIRHTQVLRWLIERLALPEEKRRMHFRIH